MSLVKTLIKLIMCFGLVSLSIQETPEKYQILNLKSTFTLTISGHVDVTAYLFESRFWSDITGYNSATVPTGTTYLSYIKRTTNITTQVAQRTGDYIKILPTIKGNHATHYIVYRFLGFGNQATSMEYYGVLFDCMEKAQNFKSKLNTFYGGDFGITLFTPSGYHEPTELNTYKYEYPMFNVAYPFWKVAEYKSRYGQVGFTDSYLYNAAFDAFNIAGNKYDYISGLSLPSCFTTDYNPKDILVHAFAIENTDVCTIVPANGATPSNAYLCSKDLVSPFYPSDASCSGYNDSPVYVETCYIGTNNSNIGTTLDLDGDGSVDNKYLTNIYFRFRDIANLLN